MKAFISENGGILAVLAVCAVIGAGYMEWRISANVTAAVNAQGAITPEQLAVVTTKLTAIKEDVSKLEGNDNRLEDKIDQVIGILLED
jgi:hypothetical protein